MVLAVAPLIANDVSYVSRINHESHISGQAQYLVTLESHFSRQAQNLVMSECSSWWQGTRASATSGEIWVDRLSRTSFNFIETT